MGMKIRERRYPKTTTAKAAPSRGLASRMLEKPDPKRGGNSLSSFRRLRRAHAPAKNARGRIKVSNQGIRSTVKLRKVRMLSPLFIIRSKKRRDCVSHTILRRTSVARAKGIASSFSK
jgi:hypothetical protein